MANFRTHMIYATAASGAGATLLLNAELASPKEAFLCWVAGTVGGLLPDIDSDNPQSLGIVFGLLGVVASVITVVSTIDQWPLIWVWLSAAAVFVALHYGVRYAFEVFTKHRGAFHSVLAGLLFAVVIAATAGFVGASSTASWFYGLFLFGGYMIHLLLDETHGVDFSNASIKRPMGGAFKFFDYKNLKASSLMVLALVGVFFFLAPSHTEFLDILGDKETYSDIMASISPLGK